MPEMGIPYVLTGPDGTRAVFNDSTDPDFVGYLDPEAGLTGLLDTADVTESFTPRTEGDGVAQGNNFFSRRVGTMQGFLMPGDGEAIALYESKVKRASRGKLAASPAVLTWTPTNSVGRMMNVWRQSKVTFNGRRPKHFVIPLATEEPYHYSVDVASQVILPGPSGGELGVGSPVVDPFSTTYNLSGQIFCVNIGDAETWPVFTIEGPITNPTLLNNTSGLSWTLTYTLQAGETMVVDSRFSTVLFNGVTNRYSAYAANFAVNKWWTLLSGSNDVRLLNTDFSVGAQVTVAWRHAWE